MNNEASGCQPMKHTFQVLISPFRWLVLGLSLFVMSCSGPSTPDDYLELGKSASAENNYADAVLYYKNALQMDSSFVPARYELGLLYGQLGDMPQSQRFLLNALEGGYAKNRILPALAAAYFKQDKLLALDSLLQEQDPVSGDPALNLQMSLFKVLWMAREGQIDLASKKLASLGTEAESCQRCLYTQAYLDSFTQPSAAMASLDALLIKFPAASEAHLLQGQLALSLRDPRRAYEHFSEFKKLQPLASFAELLLGLSALQMGDQLAANKHADNVLAYSPKQAIANHIKALLSFADANYELARKHSELSIANGVKAPANYLVAGVSAYHLNKSEIAYDHLRKASVFYPENTELQRLLLVLQFEFGDLEQAQATYLNQDNRSVKDVLFGNALAYRMIENGQFTAADNLLSSLANTPANHPALKLQTQVLQLQLDPSNRGVTDAVELSSTSKSNGNLDQLATIMILLQSGAVEKAQTEAEAWLVASPDEVDALNTLAFVNQQASDLARAQSLYKKALQLNPDNTPSLFFSAQQAMVNGDQQLAMQSYQHILRVKPTSLSGLQGLLHTTFTGQELPDFDAMLAPIDLAAISDDQIVAIADALFRWNQYARLDALLQDRKEYREWSDMLWMVWLRNSYYNTGPDKFLTSYEDYYQVNKQPDHVLFALSLLEEQGKWQLVLQVIDSLTEQLQSITSIQLVRALAHIELQQADEAEKVLNALKSKSQTDTAQTETARWYVLGRLQAKRGDLVQAANYLTAYHGASPGYNSVTQLAKVLLEADRTQDLLALVDNYLIANPNDERARLVLAMKLAPEHPAIALTLLQETRADWLVRRSWELSHNVAWLYLQQNLPNDALKYSSNAVALKPENKQVNATHQRVLLALSEVN